MKKTVKKISGFAGRVTPVCKSKRAEIYVGVGVKILIAVVLGAFLLSGLYALSHTAIMPTAQSKMNALFGYTGTGGASQGGSYEYGEVIETAGYEVTDDHGTYFVVNILYEEIDHYVFDGYLVSNPEGLLIEEYNGVVRIEFANYGMVLLDPGVHTLSIYHSEGQTDVNFQKV
ncbi:MAG: hypothetical protein IJT66_01630 [Clostridia bacterium]|nr:hypothetical protein [Clostridia bacterium]